MQFQSQVRKVTQVGFKSFVTLDYFFHFAKHEGRSVRELANGDNDEYQKSLRYFKLLSTGTKREDGMALFETEDIVRTRVQDGRYPQVRAIRITPKGKKLLNQLKPIKRSMARAEPRLAAIA